MLECGSNMDAKNRLLFILPLIVAQHIDSCCSDEEEEKEKNTMTVQHIQHFLWLSKLLFWLEGAFTGFFPVGENFFFNNSHQHMNAQYVDWRLQVSTLHLRCCILDQDWKCTPRFKRLWKQLGRTSFYTWALKPSTVGGRGETLLWQQGGCNVFTVVKRETVCGGGQMLFSQADVSSAAALSNEVNTNWFTFNYPSVFFPQLKSSAARRYTVMSESCRQPTKQLSRTMPVCVCVCARVCVCVLLEGLEIKIHDSDMLHRPSAHNMAAPSQ